VLDTLRRADPEVLVAVLAVATVRLTSWGLALRTVLGVLGSKVSARLTVLVFVAAPFANNVTAFGQAGGEPVTALFIPRTADTGYETGLAAIASITPLPGGLGGVETVLVALIVPTTGVTVAAATAAVVVHRTATYWLPTLVGDGAAAAFGADGVI
jgi:uncharacterized membrane protein YbhN (UPF0104 family)